MQEKCTYAATHILRILAMAAAASVPLSADNGEPRMDTRVIDNHYGPLVRINDWRIAGGKGDIHAPGGTVQILTDATVDVVRDECPLPGGGDVELTVSFNFERANANSAATFYFNKHRKSIGFRVRLDGKQVQVFHLDELVHTGEPVSMDRKTLHKVKLSTLAQSYAVYLNGTCLATGKMALPVTENEGRLGVIVEDAGVRITACEEKFIVHNVDFPEWTRAELLYEEPFGQASFEANWVNNGEAPTVSEQEIIWRPMSVNMLRKHFDGPIAVDCMVTPGEDSAQKRDTGLVTDAIFIWMMSKPEGDLFEFMKGLENASLAHYMSLPFYWVDFGGTNNQTTRLRRNPHRRMVRQLSTRAHLLKRDHTYKVTLVQNGHVGEFWVDGERWIQFRDPQPHSDGCIGFRAYTASLAVHGLKVWRIRQR